MNLLTWHGTVVRTDPRFGTWLHAVLWPVDPALDDLDLPVSGLTAPVLLDGVVAEPAPERGLLHLVRDGHYAGADRNNAGLVFSRPSPLSEEKFLPVDGPALALVRRILGSQVRLATSGQSVQPRTGEGFCLCVEAVNYPIAQLRDLGDHRIELRAGAQAVTLVLGPSLPPPARILLRQRPMDTPPAEDGTAFMQGAASSIVLAQQDELSFPPLTVSDEDQLWLQRHAWWWERLRFGHVSPVYRMIRKRNAYVMMSGMVEGTVFDEDGVYTEGGRIFSTPVTGRDHVSRSVDNVYIDQQAMHAAPLLPGPHVVFPGGDGGDYYHWLIKILVPLRAMLPHLPEGTRLLLPPDRTVRRGAYEGVTPDYSKMLEDWGFGDIPCVIVQDPVCRVDEVFWMANADVSSAPALCLQAASSRAKSSLPAQREAAPRARIYIRHGDARRVHNARETEAAVVALGFSVLETWRLSTHEQMALFASAEFIIAPHGADLSNIIFCAAGTKVMELSPDAHFRPFFCQISNKMNLVYGVLPCSTMQPDFESDMQVDLGRLHALVEQMAAWS